jgi:hypothetical protein
MSDYRRGDDLGRISRRRYESSGLDRQQRLTITLAVGAALTLLLGVGIGFAVGRATAPQPEPTPPAQAETTMPAGVVEDVPADTLETDLVAVDEPSDEETATVDEEPPPRPKQLAPSDGAVINASRVNLRWSEVEDDSGEPVTYAFEIQDRASDGSYGKTQVISGLKDTSYSARVLYVKRRWRAWAVDEADNKSKKTGWRYYIHKARPKVKAAPPPPPSDETT